MIRVMVVDDSPLVRKIATDILSAEQDIEVVATAATAEFALAKLEREAPDVITMDIEMPGIGGVEAIKQIMSRRPTPVVVLSSHASRGADLTLQALEAGAIDFVLKPTGTLSGGLDRVATELRDTVRSAGQTRVSGIVAGGDTDGNRQKAKPKNVAVERVSHDVRKDDDLAGAAIASRGAHGSIELVAIGTSTGGPVALKTVLQALPADFPVPIVVVQHMPPVFTKAFADRLNTCSPLIVKEAQDGDVLVAGTALIAPGDQHLTVVRSPVNAHVALDMGEAVSGHRPSVDVLMHSVAREYGPKAVGLIMTGMGKDGAAGIKTLHAKGGLIVAQDKESSVIFGMNREVILNGDADIVASVSDIAGTLQRLVWVNATKKLRSGDQRQQDWVLQ